MREETERLTDPNYERRLAQQEYFDTQKDIIDEMKAKGLTTEKKYMLETAIKAEKGLKRKKKGGKFTYGWEVFNQDTLYRAHNKRVKKNEDDIKALDIASLKSGGPVHTGTIKDDPARVDMLVADIENQKSKRSTFSRRRMFNEDKDVDYINERNKVFNEKLERHYGKYTAGIKADLERGTGV